MDTIINLLKLDLGIQHNLRDAFFIQLIKGPIGEIEKRGIKLDLNNASDQRLVVD